MCPRDARLSPRRVGGHERGALHFRGVRLRSVRGAPAIAAGDGVVSSFFLWKDGSEVSGTYWNELDFEKVGADCHVETNAIHGNPAANHSQSHPALVNPCTTYHTYAYEWTPDAIVWLVDGTEIRRETGATATAYAQNATAMQLRFNVWPGDADVRR